MLSTPFQESEKTMGMIKFGETHHEFVLVHIMGHPDPAVVVALRANGGEVHPRPAHFQNTSTIQVLTECILGEVDSERWTDEQAEKALAETDAVTRTQFKEMTERKIFCYTLTSGQRLLYVENTNHGWDSFLALIAHVRFEDGIPRSVL